MDVEGKKMLSPELLPSPFAWLPARKKVTGPTSCAGAVHLNVQDAPFCLPEKVPFEVCSTYSRLGNGPSPLMTRTRSSEGANAPAFWSAESSAVISKPQRTRVGSCVACVTVTS